MTFGEILKNKTAFVLDVQQYMDLDPATLDLLMNSTLSDNNLVVSQRQLVSLFSKFEYTQHWVYKKIQSQ